MREGGDEPSFPWFLPTLTTLETCLGLCHHRLCGGLVCLPFSRSVDQSVSLSVYQVSTVCPPAICSLPYGRPLLSHPCRAVIAGALVDLEESSVLARHGPNRA